ncbi:CAP domain-containing protein [Gracilibacillus xinjiangensis]|uniref:CAP domain-containing protein n=1 Tax=Gracilibacillus xinjiangensis TaxID=1193282 RepID=A0ABV8WXT7_9BACI
MKKILIFLVIIAAVVSPFLLKDDEQIIRRNQLVKSTGITQKETVNENHPVIKYSRSLWGYLGKNILHFEQDFGKADRTDPSLYGYEWKIYYDENSYIQVGVMDSSIVTLYTTSEQADLQPFAIGQSYDDLKANHNLNQMIEFEHIRFKLSEKDIKERPVIALDNNVFAQLFIDSFTNKIAGIRFMNKDVFELHKPYEVYYYGEIKEAKKPNDEEWKMIEKGMENQIYDITNTIRKSYGLNLLQWDEKASFAAKAHSEDMEKQNYFSHYRLNGDGLQERLVEAGAYYLSAGENIAANYVDVPAVIHGWLNSDGHREALLKEDYTHLGVGTYKLYYTQNFLEK